MPTLSTFLGTLKLIPSSLNILSQFLQQRSRSYLSNRVVFLELPILQHKEYRLLALYQ